MIQASALLDVKPSRLLATLLVVVHGAAAFSFQLGREFGPSWAIISFVLVASLIHALWNIRKAAVPLALAADGALVFSPGESREWRAVVRPSSVVARKAVWLLWRAEVGGRSGALLLLSDQLEPHAWRRLQVWTRLIARV